ncbi:MULTISPECIES: MlaD family protein [Nocardia]|uniref:MlaD family protein n=1 Tax=Nocardia TaxID=1817 RepID=UPI001F2943A1|nr:MULTISPECIES: MlaD family protein [Nocardia]
MAAAAVALVGMVSGCGFDPAAISVPGTGISGERYRIRIEFANTLNLPSQATVTVDGLHAGIVRDVTLIDAGKENDGYVVVDVEMMASVRLPVGTTAELRQPTILGDVSVALITPAAGGDGVIAPGATIGRAQTKPLLQVEDTMNVLATFVQGGAIQQAQEIINRVNSVLPTDTRQTASISEVLGTDIEDLAEHLDAVDALLGGLRASTDVVLSRTPELEYLLTDSGVDQAAASMTSMIGLITLYDGFKLLTDSLRWIGPLAQSGDAAARAFVPLLFTSRPLDLSAPSNFNKIVAILRDKVIPFVEHGPKINITGIEAAEGSSVSEVDRIDGILSALRMIGAVR